ncbi:flavodoxin [Protofrankia symbiont of Coriaria ruscifolia]|uniref:flavodoxin n=1 Tax=Protofrankia symbiont of Coriaria ruscifolia TaxID=1306542 RepID=UPI001F5E6F75|nr:flavodoxin [Protofrankia symbiont of Coriaria ruscifolia]
MHGNNDTTGAIRGVETIATGLKWKRLREPLTVVDEVDAAVREACWELGATVAASLMES